MKGNTKKSIAAILIAFVLALVMEFAVQATAPALYRYEFEGPVQNEFTLDNLELVDYTVNGNHFSSTSGDPYLFLNFENKNDASAVSSIRFKFSKPLDDWGYLQFYFPNEQGVYSQTNSQSEYMKKGLTELVVNIPALTYPQLRVDINQDFDLESIQTSSVPATKIVIPESLNPARLLGMFAVLAIIIFLLLYFNVFKKLKNLFCGIGRAIAQNPKRAVRVVLITVAIIAVLCILLAIALQILGKTPRLKYFMTVIAGGFLFSLFLFFFKYTGKKPEYFFLAIFLCAALLIAGFTPATQALSVWDDETHYAKILNLSYFGEDARITGADADFITRVYSDYSPQGLDHAYENLDARMHEGAQFTDSSPKLSYERLGYLSGATGMFLGRMFHLSFHDILIMGRVAMLLLFAVLCFLSIRKLKTGKMILSVLVLLPTCVYLASNFSYDSWVTGFTILGFAWFFSEAQEPDKPLSVKNWIIMLAAMVIGMGPKAIYFPLVFLLFFMPKTKFTTKRTLLIYRLSVIAATLFVLASFLMPMLVNGAGAGDARGGSDVNASGQIAYILSHPFDFIKMMAGFLPQYLSVGFASNYISSLSYSGDGYFHIILIVLLCFVAFTDRNEYDRFTTTLSHKIRTLIIALITIVCVASALYISFTPVGFHTVNGCQARYLMPVVFPVLYVIGINRTQNELNRNIYNTGVFVLSGLILFYNIVFEIIL